MASWWHHGGRVRTRTYLFSADLPRLGSAGFQTCCIADFQVGFAAIAVRGFGNPRHGRLGSLRHTKQLHAHAMHVVAGRELPARPLPPILHRPVTDFCDVLTARNWIQFLPWQTHCGRQVSRPMSIINHNAIGLPQWDRLWFGVCGCLPCRRGRGRKRRGCLV